MTSDVFAVRVQGVSKVYHLWNSARDRFVYPFKRLLASFLPFKRNQQNHINYREFYALRDISFDIRKGESWGFVGVNGSGKSTLLKIISGNLRPSAGRVEVDGKVVLLDYGSGFNGDFTGEENIYIKATILGLTRAQIYERFDSIVEFAELGDFINQPVKTYSSGMVSRLGFAIMAHVDADIIITDEALAVGDVFFVQKCMKYIREFLKKGTFLFVSHSTNDVISLCQNAVWLEHGVIKAIGPAAKVTQAYLEKTDISNIKDNSVDETEDCLQAQKGKSEIILDQPGLSKLMDYKLPQVQRDTHWEAINYSQLRNDIEIIQGELAGSIAIGGAQCVGVTISDESNSALSWVVGGEVVTLTIEFLAQKDLQSPIVGFQVIDHLGQILFAENSFLIVKNQPVSVKAGRIFSGKFTFQMPLLPAGRYTVRVAVGVGEEESEVVLLQTIDSALTLNSQSSCVRQGLIGVLSLDTSARLA